MKMALLESFWKISECKIKSHDCVHALHFDWCCPLYFIWYNFVKIFFLYLEQIIINFPWKSVFAFWLLPPTKIPSNQLRGKIWIFSSQKKHCMVAFKKVKIWGGTAVSFLNRIKFCLVNCLEHSTMTLTVKNSLQFSKNKDFFKVVLFGMYSTFESVSQKQFYNLYNSETNLLPALECLVVVVWW